MRINLIVLGVLLLAVSSCALTTSYGVKPKQDTADPDVYAFFVYYNNFASKYDIKQSALEQIRNFMVLEDYKRFEILNVEMAPTTKAIYEVKFYRE